MKQESVIVSDPEVLGGTPCFRGTRVPIDSLIDYLEAGDTLDEFLDNFPSVTRKAAIAAEPPAERDMQHYFRVSPNAVHQMVLALEKKGLLARDPGAARSIRLLVGRDEIPDRD